MRINSFDDECYATLCIFNIFVQVMCAFTLYMYPQVNTKFNYVNIYIRIRSSKYVEHDVGI